MFNDLCLTLEWTQNGRDEIITHIMVKFSLLTVHYKGVMELCTLRLQCYDMWPDQAKWVTCWLWSRMRFRYGCKEYMSIWRVQKLKINNINTMFCYKVNATLSTWQRQQNTKRIAYNNWMYLQINIPNIWPIPLDQVTYTPISQYLFPNHLCSTDYASWSILVPFFYSNLVSNIFLRLWYHRTVTLLEDVEWSISLT